MDSHHFIKDVNMRASCLYCSNNISENNWKSTWANEIHYKTTDCKCGKHITLRVNYNGSGHDTWTHSNLEAKVVSQSHQT